MLFIYISSGLLATVAILSLRNNFGDSRLFIAFLLFGLAISWWQQKRNKPIPFLKIILTITLIALTIKALLPFFISEDPDMLHGLIKTWIYFLILSSFIIYSKRDYYFIQLLSLGLIIFSCLNRATPKSIQLSYIFAFFIIWIISLRGISLRKDIKEMQQASHRPKWIYQELKIGIAFMLIMIILTIPLYSLIPHFNISLSYIPRLIEQRDTLTYADFPGKSIISFLTRSFEKITKTQKKEKDKAAKISKESKAELIDLEKTQTKPTFWHSAKEDKSAEQKIKEPDKEIPSQIDKVDKKAKKETSLFDLLTRILTLAIFLILLFLIYRIIAFFLSYLREKNKFKTAALENKYNLAMLLLYNLLCRVLNIFGYRYPVVIDPEEYSIKVSGRFKDLEPDYNQITALFLEARYSTHEIIKEQLEKALSCYRKILKELKNRGSFLQRLLLQLNFIFLP